ncbi:MAG: UPF0175 family protein [Candidatus Diapherotrites archaeon]|nr:UPF0175 family protein [Candidatus Diapherotrites archaeon]
MKTQLISARFEKEDTKKIEDVAKEEKTDKTSVLKKMVSMGLKQYQLEKAIKQYQEGKMSTAKAAEMAGISLWEMMDKLKEKNIANPLSEQEFKEGLKNLRKAWK